MNDTIPTRRPRSARQYLLLILAVAFPVILYNSGIYKVWFREHVIDYWEEMRGQIGEVGIDEDKKNEYYGEGYTVCLDVIDFVGKHKTKDKEPVILLQPNGYLEKEVGFKMPEPILFYYFTNGIKAVRTNSPNVATANYFLQLTAKGIFIRKIQSEAELRIIVDTFKKYENKL